VTNKSNSFDTVTTRNSPFKAFVKMVHLYFELGVSIIFIFLDGNGSRRGWKG